MSAAHVMSALTKGIVLMWINQCPGPQDFIYNKDSREEWMKMFLHAATGECCPLFTDIYSQEILHSDTDEIQFYICFSRDFLDVSESINIGQNL